MSPLTKRLTIFKVSAVLALAVLCFNAQTFAPSARANQSPALLITVTGPTPCGGQAQDTVAIVHDYSVGEGQFCFTIDPTIEIVGISSFLVLLDPASISAQGGTICTKNFDGGATAQELAESLVVTFDFGSELCIQSVSCEEFVGNQVNIALLDVTRTESQFCFSIVNSAQSADPITGVGFQLGSLGPFILDSVIPTPQPGSQDLGLRTNRGRVPEFNNTQLDFAVIAGNNFAGGNPHIGIQPGETSSRFCVGSDFSGSNLDQNATYTYLRFRGHVVNCESACCAGGGITGIVSGSPR